MAESGASGRRPDRSSGTFSTERPGGDRSASPSSQQHGEDGGSAAPPSGEGKIQRMSEEEDGSEELDSIMIMELLRRFMGENPFLHAGDWDAALVSHLEGIMDTVSFLDYEEIMQAGEHATWVGLVLDGECAVLIEGKRVATLKHGGFVGEMSLFTGLKRNADVISSSKRA